MNAGDKHLYEFGSFRLDTRERLLLRNGERVKLEGKVFETLVVLIQHSGQLVHKDEFMNQVWPDAVVEENNLEKSISVLRKVLGENGVDAKYIETVRGLGYRFAADVRELDDGVSTLVRHESRTSVTVEDEEIDLSGAKSEDGRALMAAPSPALVNVRRTPSRSRWLTNPKIALASALLIALGLAGYFVFFGRAKPPATVASIRSIAVMPFKSLNSDNSDDYLGLGLTDALITRLGSVNKITVRPTSAVRKYSTQNQDPALTGRELAVESVLDGSIQRDGDRFRLTVQLVRVSDGKHLWTDKFDEKFTDILAVEDQVSERVAEALSLKLSGDEKQRLTKSYTNNAEAHELYLKGRFLWNQRTEEALKKSIEYFQQAVAKDPNYALAYNGLADSYCVLGNSTLGGLPPREAFPKAKVAALKALELDESMAEAHASLGFVATIYDWDWPVAERELKRAIELNPDYPTTHHWYAIYLVSMLRLDEALREYQRARELDPLSLIIQTDEARVFCLAGRCEEAIEQLRKVIELDPNFFRAHVMLGALYEMERRYEESIAEFAEAVKISHGSPVAIGALGRAYAVSGRRREALEAIAKLKEMAKQRYVSAFLSAVIYTGLGDKDQAFKNLEAAYEERTASLIQLKVLPYFQPLRSDPRFGDLVKRVGLAQ